MVKAVVECKEHFGFKPTQEWLDGWITTYGCEEESRVLNQVIFTEKTWKHITEGKVIIEIDGKSNEEKDKPTEHVQNGYGKYDENERLTETIYIGNILKNANSRFDYINELSKVLQDVMWSIYHQHSLFCPDHFRCPHCGQISPEWEETKKRFEAAIRAEKTEATHG